MMALALNLVDPIYLGHSLAWTVEIIKCAYDSWEPFSIDI